MLGGDIPGGETVNFGWRQKGHHFRLILPVG